jgi:hypothetical protein
VLGRSGCLTLGVSAVLGCGATCDAFYLDPGRNFDVRLRAYSQLGIMAEGAAQHPGHGLVHPGRAVRQLEVHLERLPGRVHGPLNPTNSFTLSMAFNSSYNLSENSSHDFRYPQAKPGKAPAPRVANGLNSFCTQSPTNHPAGEPPKGNPLCVTALPSNFEDLYKYEGFLTTTLQSDYMHGKLEPRITIITDVSGIFAFPAHDDLPVHRQLSLRRTYLAIATHPKAGLGTFRAHDMSQLRATVQLN